MDEATLREVLAAGWGLRDADLRVLPGGMNSETWEVRCGDGHWVAKTVQPAAWQSVAAGLRAALVVDAGGIASGAPLPTRDGLLALAGPHGFTSLLSWVDGTPSTEPAQIGRTLARVHLLLASSPHDGPPLPWLDLDLPQLDVEPWVRPAVVGAVAAWESVRPSVRRFAFLHGDPAPDAFLAGPDGCGVIDWGSGFHGPCLFDLASAVMYVGPSRRDELVASYLRVGVMAQQEVDAGLDVALRLRWAVQAWYFAQRVADDDRTGISDLAENRTGLEDARRALAAWS